MLRKERDQTERTGTAPHAPARAPKAGAAPGIGKTPASGEDVSYRALEEQLIARWGPLPSRSKDATTGQATAAGGVGDHVHAPSGGTDALERPGPQRPSSSPAQLLLEPARQTVASISEMVTQGWYENRGLRDGTFVLVALLVGLAGWWVFRDASDADNRNIAISPAAASTAIAEELSRSTQALEQERNKVEALAQELASAWREIGAHSVTLADKAALETEVASLQNDLRQAAEQKSSLDAALANARRRDNELASLQGDLRRAAEQKSALETALADARARNVEIASLQSDLRKAAEQKSALEAALADARLRNNEVASLQNDLRLATGQRSMLEATLAEARARNQTLVDQAVAQQVLAAQSKGPVEETAASPAREVPASTATAASPGNGSSATSERLLLRAALLLRQGDIGAARSVLERAIALGDVPALLALAESYDPAFLAALGAVGTQGDVARARALYMRALATGATEAQARLDALP